MRGTFKFAALSVLFGCALIDQAAAASWWWCPPVPEFDGSGATAAMALVASIGAILFSGSKER